MRHASCISSSSHCSARFPRSSHNSSLPFSHSLIPTATSWERTVSQQMQEMRGVVYRWPMQTHMALRLTLTVEDCEHPLRSSVISINTFVDHSHAFSICVVMPWSGLLPSSKSGFGPEMTEAFRVTCRVAQVVWTRITGYAILFEYLAGIWGGVALCVTWNAHVTHEAFVYVLPSRRELRTPTSQTRIVISPRTLRTPI